VSTSIWVARHLGEDFGVTPDGTITGPGDIVGGDTALDTHDGDTSYIAVQREGFLSDTLPHEHTVMTFRWELLEGIAPAPSTVTSITVEGAMRRDDTATPDTSSGLQFAVYLPSGLALFVWGVFAFEPGLTYKDQSTSLSPTAAPYFDPDLVWDIVPQVPDPQFVQATRLTYLRAIIEGGQPRLRQKNRGSIRQKNKAARQDSIRSKSFY
jgi:hypothetical protein